MSPHRHPSKLVTGMFINLGFSMTFIYIYIGIIIILYYYLHDILGG